MIWRHRCLDHPAAQETEILYSYFCENVTTFNLITRSAPYMDSYCRLSKTLWNNCLFNWIVLFNLTAPMLFCTTFFEEEKTACWFNHTVLHLNIFHIYALIRYNVTKPCIIAIALKEANKKLTHLLIRSLTSYQYFRSTITCFFLRYRETWIFLFIQIFLSSFQAQGLQLKQCSPEKNELLHLLLPSLVFSAIFTFLSSIRRHSRSGLQ